MLRGNPAAILTGLAPHSVIFVRDGTAEDAQSVFVDFSASGRDAVLGAGYEGQVDGVALYCPTATDIEIGDVFRHDGVQYVVRFVSPQGWGVVDGDTMLLAWADGSRSS